MMGKLMINTSRRFHRPAPAGVSAPAGQPTSTPSIAQTPASLAPAGSYDPLASYPRNVDAFSFDTSSSPAAEEVVVGMAVNSRATEAVQRFTLQAEQAVVLARHAAEIEKAAAGLLT
jgi:hypothetical protein